MAATEPHDRKPEEDEEVPVIELAPLERPQTIDVNIPNTRTTIAIGYTVMVGFIVTLSLILIAIPSLNTADVKDIAEKILPQMLVAFGVVIAFYFGSKRH